MSSTGELGNSHSGAPSLSYDGRYIAFFSYSTNLVVGDTNNYCDTDGDKQNDDNCPDIFVHDQLSGNTFLVSISTTGVQGNGWPQDASISADGANVVFDSWASNLVDGDANNFCDTDNDDENDDNCADVFVYSLVRVDFYLPLTFKK